MDAPFSAAAIHDEIVLFLVQVALLLLTARVLGEMARRLGQPSVVGEILAGIILGPSLLSGLFPAFGAIIVPQTAVQGHLLEIMALLGAMFMLLITGLEIDVNLIRRHARTAISTSVGGLLVPFSASFLLAQLLPNDLLADPQQRLVFGLFFAIALSVAAIPVIAKVLMELDVLKRDIGQIIIASAMIDDITAWTMLSIVVGLAAGQVVTFGTIAASVLTVVGFVVVSFTLGRWVVKRVLNFVQNQSISPDALLTTIVIMMFAWGAVSHALYLEAVIGAFVIGILVGQMPTIPASVIHKLESLTLGIFAPIFFAVAGLKVDLLALLTPQLFGLALLTLTIACIAKFGGAYTGARLLGGRDHWTATTFASALNARGAVEIIIASIGLSIGILSQSIFSIIVMIAIVTSLLAPSALRWSFRRITVSDEEATRLRRAELVKDNLIANANRVLLPVRLRDDDSVHAVQAIEARILEQIGNRGRLSITLLSVVQEAEKTRAIAFLNTLGRTFAGHEVIKKVLVASWPAEAILEEARKDYDLMLLGTPEQGTASDVIFTPIVDHLVRFSLCPTMVIHGEHMVSNWQVRRIMVPTNGTVAARRAAEVGFALVGSGGGEVHIVNVVEVNPTGHASDIRDAHHHRQERIAQQMVDELRVLGDSLDVPTSGEVRIGATVETVVLDVAQDKQIDLIILGIDVRTGTRLYLGPRVEYILNHAPCPVMVINAAYV